MQDDLRSAVRLMLRQRGLCAVAVITLAIGVAVNTTILSLVRSILLAPEPYRAPHELFKLLPSDHMARWPFELSDLQGLAELPGVAAVAGCASPSLVSNRTYPSPLVSVTEVSGDFFSLLGARPHMGRTLGASDCSEGANTAVISYDLWEALHGRVSDVLGDQIQLNRRSFTIVGVMPPAFAPPCFEKGSVRRQAWIPIESTGDSRVLASGLSIIVRTSSEPSVEHVQSGVDEYGLRRAAETMRAPYAGMFLERLRLEEERSELDPIPWTLSERRIRCPQWKQRRVRPGGDPDGSFLRNSRPARCAWSSRAAGP